MADRLPAGTGADALPGTRYQRLISAHLADLTPGLERRLSELLALTDFGAALTERLGTRETATLILLVAMGETGARWGELFVPDREQVLRSLARRGTAPKPPRSDFRIPSRLPQAAVLRLGDEGAASDEDAAPFRKLMRDSGAASAALLRSGGELCGLLLLGAPHAGLRVSRSDFLEALSVSAAAALQKCRRDEELRSANRKLSLHVYQLRSLMDLTAGLHRAREESRVWDLLLNGAMGHVLASRAAVIAGGRVLAAKGPRHPDEDWSRLSRAAEALRERKGVAAVGELTDRSTVCDLAELHIGWVVPVASGAVRGTLFLGTAGIGRSLSSADRDFLHSLAGQAAAAVESLRLTRSSIEKEKELELARRIQARFLPAEPPRPPGWDIAGINIPCLAVGGDYYDYLALDGSLFVTIADVSGKGTGPALIMASVQASLRALYRQRRTRLSSAAIELNRFLHAHTEDNHYMTAVLSRLDPDSGRFRYLNAGHVYPVMVRAEGGVERLQGGSTVLGLFPEIEAETGFCEFAVGDLLAMFTDGLSEAEGPEGQMFDEFRIVEALRRSRGRNAREICGDLLSLARAFAGPNQLRDDLTLVVLKRTG